MECPTCQTSEHVEIDTHADGFAANLHECGLCGTMWTCQGSLVSMLHGSTRNFTRAQSTTECPICHCDNQIHIDIHADGFANSLEECGVCGALWTLDKNSLKLVHGATWAR
ncbi:MAG: hypothetical protein RQ723_05725 [Desulfuromonadales bacterium]|nr:hypothetical protein [Desulfuromonadales bacterium]